MANELSNTNEVVAHVVGEAARLTKQAMAVARAERTQNIGPRLGGPTMKQPTFNWEVEDKFNELKNIRLEVNMIFKSYSMPQAEQIAIIKNVREKRPTILETLTQRNQGKCNTTEGHLQH